MSDILQLILVVFADFFAGLFCSYFSEINPYRFVTLEAVQLIRLQLHFMALSPLTQEGDHRLAVKEQWICI